VHELYNDFFNLDKPCPKSILNGEVLREQYVQRIKNIPSTVSCHKCQIFKIKNEFMIKVWAAYMRKLNA
jgi:hypothetical protein